MNFKIALAAVLLISGGSYVTNAQQKSAAPKSTTVNAAKSFESKISAYQKEADAAKSATLLSEMTKEMTNGMAAAKGEFASASANSETSGALMKKYETRTTALNEVMQISRADASNKTAIVSALKKYAQTL
ncbi:MAG: hypothetical protein WC756_12550 [Taibaiella sp.]